MMSSFKKFWIMFSVGVPVGIVLCTLITVMTSSALSGDGALHYCAPELSQRFGSEGLAILIQSAVSGLYGGIIMGATVVYDMERWSLLRATSVHCLVTLTLYYTTGLLLCWFSFSDINETLLTFTIFVSVYVCIWLVNYAKYRIEIAKFNDELEKIKKEK